VEVVQRQPLDQLHREVGVALVDAGVEDLHHVGMREVVERLELPRQPPRRPRIERRTSGEQLESDRVAVAAIDGAVDGADASAADRFQHAVGANDLGRHFLFES
jgi:hypothetical protein